MVAPGLSWMQAAQNIQVPAPQTSEEAQAAPAPIPPEYKSLIDTLRKNQSKGTLPEDVQQEMRTIQVKEEKKQNKELNQAVKGLRKARKELQDSFEAGLYESISSPRASCHDKDQRSTADTQRSKGSAGFIQGDCGVASQAEGSTADVDLISEDDTSKVTDSALKMQDGMQSLTATLEQLQHAAEAIHESEQAAKKARLDRPCVLQCYTLQEVEYSSANTLLVRRMKKKPVFGGRHL